MGNRTISIRGVPDAVLRTLRQSAAANRRSLNSEILEVLERAPLQTGIPVRPPHNKTLTGKKGRVQPFSIDRELLARLCRSYGIARLSLFGSHASGESTAESDVDLLAEFLPGRTPGLAIVSIAQEMATLFGGRKVDLVTPHGLRPALREQVAATAVVLYDPE